MIGCSNDKKSCPNLSFCCVPATIKNEGVAAEILSAERRRLWLAAISRDDLTNRENHKTDRVCGRHFVFGKSAKPCGRFNEDWVPSLQLGHEKSKKSEESQKEATERAQRIVDRRKHEKQELEKCSVKEKIKRLAELADDRESVRHTSQQFGSLSNESVSASDINVNGMEIEDIEEVPQQVVALQHRLKNLTIFSSKEVVEMDVYLIRTVFVVMMTMLRFTQDSLHLKL